MQVRDWITTVGLEQIGKRLVNTREKVGFDKPSMNLQLLMRYGNALVNEQENVRRVQLADSYLSGAELAGVSGTSLPEAYVSANTE